MLVYLQISWLADMQSMTIEIQLTQLSSVGPVSVTTLSSVPDLTATVAGCACACDDCSGLSFGDSRTDVTPEDSSMCLMLTPPFPMIIPQLELGTNNRTTKSNPAADPAVLVVGALALAATFVLLPPVFVFVFALFFVLGCQDECWVCCCSCSM